MSSARKGFLLADALIAVFVVSMLAAIVNGAMINHMSALEHTDEAVEKMEEEAAWHLSMCQRCIKTEEPEEEEPEEEESGETEEEDSSWNSP